MQNSNGPYGNGGRPGTNGFYGPPPPGYESRLATPTPMRPNVNNNVMGMNMHAAQQQGAYLPPQKRLGVPPPIIRPDSSISNHTFASQAPMSPFMQSAPVNRPFPLLSGPRPADPYRYGPANLTQDFARLDTSNQRGPARQTPRREGPLYTLGTGRNFHNGGVRPGFANGATGSPGIIGSGVRKPQVGGVMIPMADSQADGNAVTNSKAYQLAQMIKQGAGDDPRDIDYGNPGPSRDPYAIARRTNDELIGPPRRGQVAAAASSASNESSPHAAVREANIRGNSAIYIGSNIKSPLPQWYKDWEQYNVMPTAEQVFESMPLIEGCRTAKPTTAGVLRIRNLPYSTSKSEVIALLGRNAQIVHQPIGSPFYAIHIMMDRLSGKTLDCFVEVESAREATLIHNNFGRRMTQGRHTRLGDRPVIVEQCTQQDMMAELFPRGKYIVWHGNIPKLDQSELEEFYDGVKSEGFDGFLFEEDMAHMIKHVDMPTRSPYAQRCIIRPYECIIYTIHKYPWYAVDLVRMHERDYLFKVTMAGIDCLMKSMRAHFVAKMDATRPTGATLKELVVAGLTCPGFSEFQKSRLIRHLHNYGFGQYSVPQGMNIRFGGTNGYAGDWPFTVLVVRPSADDRLLEFIAGLMRDATGDSSLSLADLHSMQTSGTNPHPFGNISVKYDKKKSIAAVGREELRMIEKVLTHMLPRTRAEAAAEARGLLGVPT